MTLGTVLFSILNLLLPQGRDCAGFWEKTPLSWGKLCFVMPPGGTWVQSARTNNGIQRAEAGVETKTTLNCLYYLIHRPRECAVHLFSWLASLPFAHWLSWSRSDDGLVGFRVERKCLQMPSNANAISFFFQEGSGYSCKNSTQLNSKTQNGLGGSAINLPIRFIFKEMMMIFSSKWQLDSKVNGSNDPLEILAK